MKCRPWSPALLSAPTLGAGTDAASLQAIERQTLEGRPCSRPPAQEKAAGPAANQGALKTSPQVIVAGYQRADLRRSLWHVCNSFTPYFSLMWLMHASLAYSYLVTLALAVPASGFLVRVFIIMHDCSHGSFFRSRRANDVLGTLTGILLFTPYYGWRRRHSLHHATSSDLGRRGWWDVRTLTVREYAESSRWQRFGYRLYRHPLVLFVIGPLAFFLVIQRFSSPGAHRRERLNVRLTNLAILCTVAGAMWLVGPREYLLLQLPVMFLSSAVGLWLFYVQHQFEGAYWTRHSEWDFVQAALAGSSYYKLPRLLQWFTGNIGFHHIHHLNPKIPNYRLQFCHDENPELQRVNTLTLWSSRRSLSCKLWDEDGQRMVSFKEISTPFVRASWAARDGGDVNGSTYQRV